MATLDSDSAPGRTRRSVNHQLPLVPFIDFLICLVVFLLESLAFANFARLQSSALLPGKESELPEAKRKRLHVELKDEGFHISWQIGDIVVASEELPAHVVIEGAGDGKRRGDRHYPELARFLERSFREQGMHQDPSDPTLDEAVLHVQNSTAYEDVIAVLDALRAPQRAVPWSKQTSVFALSFAAD